MLSLCQIHLKLIPYMSQRWNLDPIDPDRVRVLLCQEGSNSSKFALYDSHHPPSSETGSVRIPNDVSRSWNGTQLHTIASRANEIVGSLAEGRRSSDFRSYSVKTLPSVSSHDGLSQQRKVKDENRLKWPLFFLFFFWLSCKTQIYLSFDG
jgi:hypothetical protein